MQYKTPERTLTEEYRFSIENQKKLEKKVDLFIKEILQGTDLPPPVNVIPTAAGPIVVRWKFNKIARESQNILLECSYDVISAFAYFDEQINGYNPSFESLLNEFRTDRSYEELPIIKKLMMEIYSYVI